MPTCVSVWLVGRHDCVWVCSESVWGVLSGQVNVDNCPSAVMHDVRELETWILRLLSAPVSVPGKTRVEVSRPPACLNRHSFFMFTGHNPFGLHELTYSVGSFAHCSFTLL